MAFGTPVAAAVAYSASGGTSVSPAYPSGLTSTDQIVLIVGQKPSTANGGTVTTPSGWTLQDGLTGAGGYGTTLGADTGNTNLLFYTKDTVTGNETGNLSVTIGTNNVTWAFMVRVPTNGGTISYGSSDGSDTSAGNVSVTLAANPGLTTDDLLIWAMCVPTDVSTPNQFSAHAISATGATFDTPTEFNEPDSQTGNDIGGFSAWTTVASGTASAAPTITATAGGTTTNVRGPLVLLRLRETLPERTGSLSATETGSDTFSAEGDVIVKGSLAVTEVGSDTFSASGTTVITSTGSLAATETGTDTFSSSGQVIIKGALSATEVGNDTANFSGKVIVTGSLAVTETGNDTFTASGSLANVSSGSLAATETGDDTFSSTGKVIIAGALAATEDGEDVFSGAGTVLVSGSLSAAEVGTDTFDGSGTTIGGIMGSLSASETGSDILGGYVQDGYVEEGYVNPGITGTLGRIGTLAATESGGAVGFGINAVMKYFNGTSWVILYKDPTVYT